MQLLVYEDRQKDKIIIEVPGIQPQQRVAEGTACSWTKTGPRPSLLRTTRDTGRSAHNWKYARAAADHRPTNALYSLGGTIGTEHIAFAPGNQICSPSCRLALGSHGRIVKISAAVVAPEDEHAGA